MNRKEKHLEEQLKKKFLKEAKYQKIYKHYLETNDSKLFEQLNGDYSDFVNYTILLSLIQTNIKYTSLHVRESLQKQYSEIVSEESLEYAVNQEQSTELGLPPKRWEFIMEDEALIEAVSSLTKREEQVIWLLFVEDKTNTDITTILGVSQQSISKTKRRALKKLESFLEKGG
ncbi:MAG: sigma-70 family RNA polymerase sigma factor [Desemzia incerta]